MRVRGRQKRLTDKCITKARPCMGDSLPELEAWSPAQPAGSLVPAAPPVCFREGRAEGIWSVHRLPEAFLSYLPSGWREFPAGWSASISEETLAQPKAK